MKRLRALIGTKGTALWAAEIVGVALLSAGMWMIYAPAAVIVVALYLIVAANTGGDNASD